MYAWILEMIGNMGIDDIPGAEPMHEVLLLRPGSWKSQSIHQAHLAAPMPVGFDEQGNNALDLHGFGGTGTNARSIKPMLLVQTPTHPAKLRAPAGPTLAMSGC